MPRACHSEGVPQGDFLRCEARGICFLHARHSFGRSHHTQHSPTLKHPTLRRHLPPRPVQVLNSASPRGDCRHAQTPPSAPLRAQLRERIINRIAELKLKDFEAAEQLGLSPGQMSRLRQGEDVFTLDRLIDAAANIGITVRMTATRPYGQN